MKRLFLFLLALFCIVIVVVYSPLISSGVSTGIRLCLDIIIPSLFLFTIIATFLIKSQLADVIFAPISGIGKYIFGIPKEYTVLIILSLLGGYPIGSKLISTYVAQKRIDTHTASLMICYSVNAGPAFLIIAIGSGCYKSISIGVYLYIAQVIACFGVGIITHIMSRLIRLRGNHIPLATTSSSPTKNKPENLGVILVESVTDATKTLATICSFILLFNALSAVVSTLFTSPIAKSYIQALLDVTYLVNNISDYTLNFVCIATAFSGFCVILQVYAMTSKVNISIVPLLTTRPVYIMISLISFNALLPKTATDCFSVLNEYTPKTVNISYPCTIFMIILAIILLFYRSKSAKIDI